MTEIWLDIVVPGGNIGSCSCEKSLVNSVGISGGEGLGTGCGTPIAGSVRVFKGSDEATCADGSSCVGGGDGS